MKPLGTALLLLLIATAAFAQSAEFGRAGGDEIALPIKQPGNLSGSFGLTMSNSAFGSRALGGTVGGALVADRLWFFAAAQRDENRQFVANQLPAAMADGKLIAQLGSRQMLTAAASTAKDLTLHYTGVISSNSFFTAKIDSRRSTQPAFFTHW